MQVSAQHHHSTRWNQNNNSPADSSTEANSMDPLSKPMTSPSTVPMPTVQTRTPQRGQDNRPGRWG